MGAGPDSSRPDASLGRLDTRVEVVSSSDEVGQLSGAFNAMAERLQSSFARERELEQARKELISAVSHDLRTPLASIRAMVESRADGVVSDPETVSCYMRTSLAEVENLGQLVDDLFELSRMDAGELELHLEEASLQDLVSDTLESMSAQAGEARKLSLLGTVNDELKPVVMDTRRVQRVMYNLVQNSIRHTPPDGTIQIRAEDAGEVVQVQVADTGEGIPETEIPRLVERSCRPDRFEVEAVRRRGFGAQHRQGHLRGPRRPHLGRECRRPGQHFQLHPAQGPPGNHRVVLPPLYA